MAARKPTVPDRNKSAEFAALLRRWSLRLLGALGMLGVAAVMAGAAWQLSQLPVERIVVTGELQHVSRAQLQAMVSESLDGGFLGADLHDIRGPLEALPWVRRVAVKRRWPVTLEIQVWEQFPIARWGESGFVNHQGVVFRPARIPELDELPMLAGPQGSERELMSYYKQIQERLQPLDLQVDEITMSSRGGVRVRLGDSFELIFGRGEFDAKLARFTRVFKAELGPEADRILSVDLRYSNGVAVAWLEQQPEQEPNEQS
jgi:cell division protein FtsQ